MRQLLIRVVATSCTVLGICVHASAADRPAYADKNKYFQFTPPEGWAKKEFADPRTKVSFDVPGPIGGQNRAGLFFLIHPISGKIDLRAEAEDRVSRLQQMGSPDAKTTTVEFAGVKAERVDGQMGQRNLFLRVFMFTKYGRSYVVQYSATKQDFDTYWPVAEAALRTFTCTPPVGTETTSASDKHAIETGKVRVWITALKEPDLWKDAFNSLLAAGPAAIPQLEEAERTGTAPQKQRASELLKQIRAASTTSSSAPTPADTRPVTTDFDPEHAKRVFAEGAPLYAWCDSKTKVTTYPDKYTLGPFHVIASPDTPEPVPFGLTWSRQDGEGVGAEILNNVGTVGSNRPAEFSIDLSRKTVFYRPDEKMTLKNRPIRITPFKNRGASQADLGFRLELYVDPADNRVASLVENTPPLPLYLYPFGDARMEWSGTMNEVSIRNPSASIVRAGLRSGKQGRNVTVPPAGVRSVSVPNGSFDIYFVYAGKPETAVRGNSFTLSANSVEIEIGKAPDGSYTIRPVK